MQKFVLIFLSVLLAKHSQAQYNTPINTSSISIQPKIGYSLSKSSFNIAGNEMGQDPNVLSELIWSSTHSLESGVNVTFSRNKFQIDADITINETIMGNVSDFDYKGDNRTLDYSKSFSRNDKGFGYSLKLQPGYSIIQTKELTITPFLSIDYSYKKLNILNDEDWDKKNPRYIDNLNSYYKYKFPNYGAGVAMQYGLSKNWSTQLAVEGYLAKYYAYGNWNNNANFEKPRSFEHKGNGKKLASNLGLSYNIDKNICLGVNYNLNHFSVSNGKDYLYTLDEGLKKARLNNANEIKHAFLMSLRFSVPLFN